MKYHLFILAAICIIMGGLQQPRIASARVYLDITSADLRKLPIAIPYFIDKKTPESITNEGEKMADLMGRALTIHEFISIVPSTSYNNDRATDWEKIGADYVVLGSYENALSGMVLEIRFIDTHNNKMIAGKRYRAPWAKNTNLIRKFCDEIIEKLTGEPGISNTKIAFVSDDSGHKEIYIADILGDTIRQVTRHRSITVSPRFSPDGSRLAYTSYHRNNPDLYITDLSQRKTTRAISYRNGLNMAPAWSPDGKTLITTLSKDGNPDLYLLAPNGNILKRLTKNEGINVSASWAPDGSRFAFVSDRSGTPQVYIMDLKGRHVRRLTYSGKENTTPSWSPKGDMIAYTGINNGSHHLFIINPEGGEPLQLTEYWGNYESPSWSPDGRQIIFSRTRNNEHQLCRISLKGGGVIPMYNLKGNQTFPQWSPRLEY